MLHGVHQPLLGVCEDLLDHRPHRLQLLRPLPAELALQDLALKDGHDRAQPRDVVHGNEVRPDDLVQDRAKRGDHNLEDLRVGLREKVPEKLVLHLRDLDQVRAAQPKEHGELIRALVAHEVLLHGLAQDLHPSLAVEALEIVHQPRVVLPVQPALNRANHPPQVRHSGLELDVQQCSLDPGGAAGGFVLGGGLGLCGLDLLRGPRERRADELLDGGEGLVLKDAVLCEIRPRVEVLGVGRQVRHAIIDLAEGVHVVLRAPLVVLLGSHLVADPLELVEELELGLHGICKLLQLLPLPRKALALCLDGLRLRAHVQLLQL
mmetsp:Transcript_7127/g.25810  ORF Transcript_7127/g.25810 Transcript_7127/m.25810 type:complete len:320 (+) Transcript_7127:1064-2023(+)